MRLALAIPEPMRALLATEARRHGHDVVHEAPDGAALAADLDVARPDVALVSASPESLTRSFLDACDDRGVRVLAAVATDAERRHTRELGLFETVDASASWAAIEVFLVAGEPRDIRSPSLRSGGTVIAVWGPGGSPGRTTIAIGIAAELAAAGYSVALADVDTHSASIAPALGMLDEAPGFAAACRLAGAESLSQAEFERIGQRYHGAGSSFWVLTGIGQPSRWPELSAQRVASTIAECRSWVDFTVLDVASSLENDEEISSDIFAPRRNAATIASLRAADHVVAVGAADPVGLSRFLRAHGDLVELLDTESRIIVMNKVRSSSVGLNPLGQVRQTLSRFGGIDDAVLVPWDLAALDAAVLSGSTLPEVAPRSPARTAIRELVHERLLPDPARPVERARRTRRAWFGRTATAAP